MQKLKVETICNMSDFSEIREQWQLLSVNDDKSTLFTSFAWVESWLNTYWQESFKLHISLIKADADVLAIIPLYLKTDENKYYLLGSGESEPLEVSTEYMDFLVSRNSQDVVAVYLFIAKYIETLSPAKCCFRNCIQDSHLWQVVHCLGNVYKFKTGRQYRLNLQGDFKELLEGFSKNQKKKSKLLKNRFEKNRELSFAIAEGENFEMYWSILKNLHQADWQSRGKPGAMASDEFNSFHNSLHVNHPDITHFFSILRFSKDVIAINFYYQWQGVNYFYLSGSVKGEFSKLSPGNMLHTLTISALSNSPQQYDFMKGSIDDSYKSGFCTLGDYFYSIELFGKGYSAKFKYCVAQFKSAIRFFLG